MEITGKVEIYSRNKKSPVEEKDKKRLKEGAGWLPHSSRRGRYFNPSEVGDQEILC